MLDILEHKEEDAPTKDASRIMILITKLITIIIIMIKEYYKAYGVKQNE